MTLTRDRIVDAAFVLLCDDGLAGTSMRRVAQVLDVRAGALYHHVPSKQDLLTEVAARILADLPAPTPATDVRAAATAARAALLRVRDGAEVVSFVHAYAPDALAWCRDLPSAFAALGPERSVWAARTLLHFLLGSVAEEQNRIELVTTAILDDDASARADAERAFRFGVETIVAGLGRPERS